MLPAAKEDADPFVSQSADDDPVALLGDLVDLVKGAGPEAVADRWSQLRKDSRAKKRLGRCEVHILIL